MQWTPTSGDTPLISAPSPVRQPSFGQLDDRLRCFLGLLVEPLQRQEDLPATAFQGKQDTVDDAIAIDPYLPDVAVETPGGS
jgi:hypothetical protein